MEQRIYEHSGQYRKRRELVEQCIYNNIPARMGRYSESGKRLKPTTLGAMRRKLRQAGVEPIV